MDGVSVGDIRKIINSSLTKSHALDQIPISLLTNGKNQLAHELTTTENISLPRVEFPPEPKAFLNPLVKK